MFERIPPVLLRIIDWTIRDRRRRLAVAAMFWALVLIALARYADRIVWLGIALGVLVPVSAWIVWNGFSIPHVDRHDYFMALTSREFEELVALLIVPLGYTEVRVVGGASDLGVDVLCRDPQGRRVAIQCKRYKADNDVTSSEVQTFMGGMVAHDAKRGIIVTSSAFSAPARDLARDQDIRLIDGEELSRMLEREERSLRLG